MNYIWCLMIIVSIVVSIFNGTVDQTINSAFEGAKSAVFTVLSFAGVMCFWTGIMKIAENAGLSQKLEKLLKPIINFLFPNAGQNAKKYIAVNMSANILGMGNAATPMGIKAMQCLDKENNNPLYTSKNVYACRFEHHVRTAYTHNNNRSACCGRLCKSVFGYSADLDFFIHRRIYCFNTDKITI